MKKKQLHKSNWLVTMLLLVMAILMPYGGAWAQTPSKPSIGDGSVDKPYQISTAAELAWFRDQVNSGNNSISATLTEDIDLSEFCHAADGTKYTEEVSWTPIGNSLNNRYRGTLMATGRLLAISTSMPPLVIMPVSSALLMLAASRTSLSTMRR